MKKAAICFLSLLLLLLSAVSASAAVRKVGVAVSDGEKMSQAVQEIMDHFSALETDDIQFELFLADAKGNVDTQMTQVKNLCAQGMEVLLLNPVNASAAAVMLENEVPLVLFGSELIALDERGVHIREGYESLMERGKVCCSGSSPRDAGLAQGAILASQPNGGDIDNDGVIRYVMIQGGMSPEESRIRTEFSLRLPAQTGRMLECLADMTNHWGQSQGHHACAEALAQFGSQIDVIFCSNDSLAFGAAIAIEEEGLQVGKDMYLLGIDGLEGAVAEIRNGRLTGTVKPDLIAEYDLAVEAAVRFIKGQNPGAYSWAPYTQITAETVNQ